MQGLLYLGFDFGAESACAILIDHAGRIAASAVSPYASGQIIPGSSAAADLFDQPLPAGFALQDPADWLDSMAMAARAALHAAGDGAAARAAGIGCAFTSCTVLPCRCRVSSPSLWPIRIACATAGRPHRRDACAAGGATAARASHK